MAKPCPHSNTIPTAVPKWPDWKQYLLCMDCGETIEKVA